MSQIKLTGKDPVNVETPQTGEKRIFLNSNANNDLSYKDETGTVTNLETALSPNKNINEISGNYTLQSSDNGNIIELNTDKMVKITFPTGLSEGFNTEIVTRTSAAQIEFLAASGVALDIKGGLNGVKGISNKVYAYHSGTENTLETFVICEDTSNVYSSPNEVSGLEVWLDFSDASTITEVAGDISVITDKSANASTFTQATASLRPTVVPNAQNGLQAASFINNSLSIDTFDNFYTGDWTMYYAGDFRSQLDDVIIMMVEFGSADIHGLRLRGSDRCRTYIRGLANTVFSSGGNPSLSNPHLGKLSYGASGSDVLKETSSFTDNGQPFVGSDTNADGFFIGSNSSESGQFLDGHIYEIIIYSRRVTTEEDLAIRSYLITKWGL